MFGETYNVYGWLDAFMEMLEGVRVGAVPILLRAKWHVGDIWKDSAFKEYNREYIIDFTMDHWVGEYEFWNDEDQRLIQEIREFDRKLTYCVTASAVWGEFRFKMQGINSEVDLEAVGEKIKEYLKGLEVKFLENHAKMQKLKADVANKKCSCGNPVTVQYDSLGVKCLDCLYHQNICTSADAERELHPVERYDDNY